MKKFSKISDYEVPVPREEKVDEATGRREELRHRLLKMMDDLLSVRSYGSARPEIMIPTRIAGKEMLAEALVDLIESGGNKDVVRALEALKSTNKDWRSIDQKIEELSGTRNLKLERRIMEMVDKWGDDEALLAEVAGAHGANMDRDAVEEAVRCVGLMIPMQSDDRTRERLAVVRSSLQRI